MTGLRLVCLGCGDAFSERWYSSCLALESGGERILIDCPHPIRKILREAGASAGVDLAAERISGLVLTHLHADHASGLEGWAFYHFFALKRQAVLLTHPDVADRIWDHHLADTMSGTSNASGPPARLMGLADYFDVRPLSESEPVRFGPFAIACRRTIHPIPTFALRIEAAGRRFGYSCDTSFDPGLIAWLADADLIVHETNLGIHTPYERLAELPEDLRRKMRLIHYTDDFDLERSVIEPLVQGRAYEV